MPPFPSRETVWLWNVKGNEGRQRDVESCGGEKGRLRTAKQRI